jgi:hypothetical protein
MQFKDAEKNSWNQFLPIGIQGNQKASMLNIDKSRLLSRYRMRLC